MPLCVLDPLTTADKRGETFLNSLNLILPSLHKVTRWSNWVEGQAATVILLRRLSPFPPQSLTKNNIQLSAEQPRLAASCTLGLSFWERVLISGWHCRASSTAAQLYFLLMKTGRTRETMTHSTPSIYYLYIHPSIKWIALPLRRTYLVSNVFFLK